MARQVLGMSHAMAHLFSNARLPGVAGFGGGQITILSWSGALLQLSGAARQAYAPAEPDETKLCHSKNMKSTIRSLLISLAALGISAAAGTSLCAADAPSTGPYHFLKDIPIPGEGGWDYLFIDAEGRRLYVSHATRVVVVDIDKGEVVGEIGDTPGVHGFAVAPEMKRGFSSNGRGNQASIVELDTLKTIQKVDTGQNPDAIIYEPAQQEVYAFNGRSGSATVIEAKTGKVVATVTLAGKPEFAAADPKAGRVFNNLEDKNEIAVIDIKKHEVVDRWSIAPGTEASGMAFDAANHRLFIGCGNKLMEMIDTTNGKVVASVPIGDGVDACAFDPETKYAFSSCDGTTTIAHEDSPDKLTVVQTLKTEPRARTIALDARTHNIYLPTAKFEAPRKMVPGTFKIVVYGMGAK
jgi:YVTN family beta-propeller protein